MNVRCPSCATVYRVDPGKVPAGGVRARCAVCSHVFAVDGTQPREAPAAPVAPVFTPAAVPSPPAAPRAPVAPAAPPAPAAFPARTLPPAVARLAGPRPAAPPLVAPVRPAAAPAAPAAPAGPPARPAAPARAPVMPAPAPAPAAPAAPAAAAAPAPGGSGPGRRATGPLRPVNPFMAQDPKQKARRLARALISDMLVYHPEKRQQGLREGTLPQLFKDEIEKSWQEYVEQVGKELAESTPFWTEGLNEILAGGNKIF